jgi:hypothetical protein
MRSPALTIPSGANPSLRSGFRPPTVFAGSAAQRSASRQWYRIPFRSDQMGYKTCGAKIQVAFIKGGSEIRIVANREGLH